MARARGRAVIGIALLAIGNAVALVGAAAAAGVVVNLTPSQPLGLYRSVERAWTRDDLVTACLTPRWARIALERGYVAAGGACGTHTPLIKRVVALGGDRVTLDGTGVRVDGRLLPNTRPLARDGAGRALPRASDRTLAAGEVWLLSDVIATSIDSRYFGPVDAARVRHALEPLWTL